MIIDGWKEGNVLFKDALNTFYVWLYDITHMVKNHSDSERRNSLPPHGLSFLLAARVILYAPSHKQDSTYHSLCCSSRGALAEMRSSSIGPPWMIDPTTHHTTIRHFTMVIINGVIKYFFPFKRPLLVWKLVLFLLFFGSQ